MGVFLFMLFFQPFSIRFTDLNSVLVFNAGFVGIVFILLYLIHIFSRIFRQPDRELPSYVSELILFVLNAVAFTFYLRYVGQVRIGFYDVLKIVLICLAPSVILVMFRIRHELKKENEVLWKENALLQNRLQETNENPGQRFLEFYSADTASELLKIPLAELLLIKSADNYIEIYYRDDNTTRKKLVRNTLKTAEQLLKPYAQFLRCHRTCIVNILYIDKLHFKADSSFIKVREMEEPIPVSRQYLLKLKEAIALRQG